MIFLLYGGTGQGLMMKDLIKNQLFTEGDEIHVVDEHLTKQFFPSDKFYNKFDYWLNENKNRIDETVFAVTIGNPHAQRRCDLYAKLKSHSLKPLNLIHKNAEINSPFLGSGLQIHSGVKINSFAVVGHHCILNTNALLEHDAELADGVELGPGSIVLGQTKIGENTWVGAGAIVKDHLEIGKNVIIGMGAVVTKPVRDNVTVVGIPAREL